MGNSRKLIREKFKTILSGHTNAGSRVFENRARPIWQTDLPALLIFTEDESVSVFSEAPREYRRNLSLVVECYAAAKDDLDDVLDTLSGQVEDLVELDDSLGGLANATTLTKTEMNIIDDGQNLTGTARLTFSVDYFTSPMPTTPVSFDGVTIEFDVAPKDGRIGATDQIDFGEE